jgi:hypothetical protein
MSCDLHCRAAVNPGLNQIASRALAKIVGHQAAVPFVLRIKRSESKLATPLVPGPSKVLEIENSIGWFGEIPVSRLARLRRFRSLSAAASPKKTYAGRARSAAPEFAKLARQMT